MSSTIRWPESRHFPVVQNHIAIDPTPLDQAIYIPSVTPGYAQDVHAGHWPRQTLHDIKPSDLNFLDPQNPYFKISHVMSSAGQALHQSKPCIITERDRASTVLLVDSGGFQVASGRFNVSTDIERQRLLGWMEEHADLAMTLDVPTGPLLRQSDYLYKNFKECLDTTLVHLDYFAKHRTPGKIALLNVLQGNDPAESDAWYDAVKHYPFEGWAFAGRLRQSMELMCRRILIMYQEGLIQTKKWIHVLGTAELETAALLTAMQRAINAHINPNLRISFDTATPFRMLTWNQTFCLPSIEGTKLMTMTARDIPDDPHYVGSSARWPWPSPLGDRLAMGDLCVPIPPNKNSHLDKQSYHYIAHHNVAAMCWGIALVNRALDAQMIVPAHPIMRPISAAAEAIDKIMASKSLAVLQSYKATFSRLRFGHLAGDEPDIYNTGDEERSFVEPY